MARLTITAGPISSNATAEDAKAQEVLELFVAHMGGPTSGTNQEKLDFVVAEIIGFLRQVAQEEKRRADLAAARNQIEEALQAIEWE